MRFEVWVPMLSSCAHVLGALGPYRALIPASVKLELPDSPSFVSLQRHSEEFAAFRGGRDLFAALTTLSACGYEGPLLAEIVNERLAVDEQLQGRTLDRLAGPWLSLWSDAVQVYQTVWPVARGRLDRSASRLRSRLRHGATKIEELVRAAIRPRSGGIEELVIVALVEPAIGMHRAANRVVILEALPYLWPYCLTHEVVHAVVPQYRLDSPVHQLAGELLTDLAAETLGRSLTAPGYRGFKPLDGFAERWDGWKLSYGSDLRATADTARARAVEVWDAYASSGETFEDAIDRLAAALRG